jgi:hypothetical protein
MMEIVRGKHSEYVEIEIELLELVEWCGWKLKEKLQTLIGFSYPKLNKR